MPSRSTTLTFITGLAVALCLLLFYRAAYRVTEDPLGGVGTWLESLFYRRSTKQTESGS